MFKNLTKPSVPYLDCHSHILPQIDDGSKSVEESIALLSVSYQQGVRKMIATPHFYASDNTPAHFLQEREESYQRLREGMKLSKNEFPDLLLGAEVTWFEGIGHCKELEELKIEASNYVLIEMPMSVWSDRMLDELCYIKNMQKLSPIIAHVDRYLGWQKKSILQRLYQIGVPIQMNASFFYTFGTRREAAKMVKNNLISFIGSDCHNMNHRPPNIEQAINELSKHVDKKQIEEWMMRMWECF